MICIIEQVRLAHGIVNFKWVPDVKKFFGGDKTIAIFKVKLK